MLQVFLLHASALAGLPCGSRSTVVPLRLPFDP